MKTWPKDTSYRLTLPTAFPPSWFQRRTQRKCGILSTTTPLMKSPEEMSRHSQTLDNASKTCKEWNYSASLTSDGATITSADTLEMNGKQLSRHAGDYSNQRLCFSA